MQRLSGRVAIVTGGAKGIGKVSAKALAAEGATVVIADIVPPGDTVDWVRSQVEGARVLGVETDVSDESSVRRLIEQAISEAGKIDILVNNAAIYSTLDNAPCEAISVELWDAVMGVNVRGPFLLVRHVAPT